MSKKIPNKLRRAKLEQVYDLYPVGILEVDTDGVLIDANKTLTDLFFPGYPKEHLYGVGPDFLKKVANMEWVGSPSFRASRGEVITNFPYAYRGRNFLLNAIPLSDSKGEITGSLTIAQDITEYESERIEHTKALSRLDRLNLIAEMAAGVAHEVRNPITVIKGYLQCFSRKSSQNINESFQVVLDEVERIEKIISVFLSLAKNKVIDQKVQNLNSIIRHLEPLVISDANMRGIKLKTILANNLPDLLLDEEEINQLILNLARNGMESQKDCGTIEIETSYFDNKVYLYVADSGYGINEDHMAKIFDPFFSTKENGTGLGLSVCSGIVSRHGGTIEVQSRDGKGTKFIISFPIPVSP